MSKALTREECEGILYLLETGSYRYICNCLAKVNDKEVRGDDTRLAVLENFGIKEKLLEGRRDSTAMWFGPFRFPVSKQPVEARIELLQAYMKSKGWRDA